MHAPADSSYELDAETLARIRRLHIRIGAQVTEIVAGEYRSTFRGSGIEFEEVRPYQPGDDVRSIDWNVTARHNAPYVKLYREERELTVLLVVDLSASMAFGSRSRLKRELMAEAGAALAFAAVRNRDNVGVVGFEEEVELYIPPRKGSGHVWRIVRALLAAPSGRGTNLAGALEFVGHVQRRRAAVFVLSDFRGRDWQRSMGLLASRHDTTALVLSDPREQRWNAAGLLRVRDPETGLEGFVDSSSKEATWRFEQLAAQQAAQRDQDLDRCGVGRVNLEPGDNVVETLLEWFRRRELRR
jgi:uncharacterized protein (DUF58 family)